ncbi:MAG: pyruvate dehydrogenase (acetyl-transferring) E1 component subunit alpha [Solimonas sp.]
MHSDPAATRVAAFDIFLTQFLDAEGQVRAPLPEFARRPETLRQLYRTMVETRSFDKRAVALQRTGQLGTYAACLGQEAIGTGIGYALRPDDIFVPSYREYAAQFLRGVKMRDILLYWGGDERGMAYVDSPAQHDFPLSLPSATQLPHAVGVAYALRLKAQARAVLAACGDGATSRGDFYESISSARIWNLPIVFVVSNNQWATSQPRQRQTGAETLAQKALAGGLHGEQVDGNDAVAVRFVLERALERARGGGGPTLVEALSYRLHDHSTDDDARRYRTEDEVRAAWDRCPIKRLKRYIESQGMWSVEEEEALLIETGELAEQAVQEYLAMPPRPPQAIFEHLYATLPEPYAAQRDAAGGTAPQGH